MIDVLYWPEYKVRPEIRADYCQAYVVRPSPRSWEWMEFSFHFDSLIELCGVLVLIPNWLNDELEAAQYLLYRAFQARLVQVEDLAKIRQVGGNHLGNLLYNVFVVLQVSYEDRERVVNRIWHRG